MPSLSTMELLGIDFKRLEHLTEILTHATTQFTTVGDSLIYIQRQSRLGLISSAEAIFLSYNCGIYATTTTIAHAMEGLK